MRLLSSYLLEQQLVFCWEGREGRNEEQNAKNPEAWKGVEAGEVRDDV